MKHLFYLTLIITLTTSANGQRIDNKLQTEIDSLKLFNIDTSLIYSFYCVGGYRLDTCISNEPQYLFWLKENRYFLKKFDNCQNYKPIILDTINPLSFYLSCKNEIDKEEIKMPYYLQSKSKKKEIVMTSTISHDCFYKMNFQLKMESIYKKVSDFNLTFKNFDDGKKNEYYIYNQSTKLKDLIEQLTQLIKQLNTKGKFEIE